MALNKSKHTPPEDQHPSFRMLEGSGRLTHPEKRPGLSAMPGYMDSWSKAKLDPFLQSVAKERVLFEDGLRLLYGKLEVIPEMGTDGTSWCISATSSQM